MEAQEALSLVVANGEDCNVNLQQFNLPTQFSATARNNLSIFGVKAWTNECPLTTRAKVGRDLDDSLCLEYRKFIFELKIVIKSGQFQFTFQKSYSESPKQILVEK